MLKLTSNQKEPRDNDVLPEKNVNGITFRIRHTMLPVSNMERTLDFYTRLLGMGVQRIRDVPERGERVRYLVLTEKGHFFLGSIQLEALQ